MTAELTKSLIEKVFIGAIAALLSTFILHSYNLHVKAFEGAQTQLRSISSISVKSKDDILLAIGEIRTIANSLPLRLTVSKPSSVRPGEEVVRQLVNIRSAAAVLQSRLPEAASAASSIETKLYRDIYENFSKQSKSFRLTESQLKQIDTDIVTEEVRFLNIFDGELADLLAKEYEKAYRAYYESESVPRYAQPLYLGVSAIVFSLILVLIFVATAYSASVPAHALRYYVGMLIVGFSFLGVLTYVAIRYLV